ncbi:glycosyltransferase family 2 protein [Actinoplanes sp. KI2]|uniref:glycosyltransferase family A protein n=1 Tax=Actinoplanes sp. KI2 TaxID=2983315 RepID=UPI0021D59A6A|nr:glycosyltransferase family A protein [Actinoplanes sp. KI2]MCU7723681.1 glycosyltransferase family 2 protein [Actinoplanes sp. KI2]
MIEPHPLAVAALQARSVAARAPLARAASEEPWPLGELARVIALQDLRPDDQAEALAILARLRRAGTIAPAHQGLHCQIAYAAGDRTLAAALLAEYTEIAEPIRTAVTLDLANPYAGGNGSTGAWSSGRNGEPRALPGWETRFAGLLPHPSCRVTEGDGPPLDRLVTGTAQRIGHPRRITTIVTTWRPGRGLLTAIRSLVAQTWTNHEILLVDDGSPVEFDPILRAATGLDPRVRLIRMVTNGGTYVARNAGLDAATGDFVTFQDSDDWSHPLRLERQVAPLLADDAVFSTTSAGMRVTPDLVLTRPGVEQTRSYNLSSLMFRRAAALNRVGYLDPVRKGADAEYVERARAVFGRAATQHLGGAPLALIRLSGDSLSSEDYRPGWMHPARRSYLSAFQAWHTKVKNGTADAKQARAFAVPRRIRGETGPRAYDVVLAGDWTTAGGAGAAGIGQLRALRDRKLRAALLQLDVLSHLRQGPRNLDPEVQELINRGELTQVELTDDVRARLVVCRTPKVLQHAPDLPSGIRAQRVVIESATIARSAAASSRRLFGRRPLWAPAGPDGRRLLATALAENPLAEGSPSDQLTALDLPGTVDPRQWRLDRRGPRADRPVVGRRCRGGRAEWRRLRAELPDGERVDVRLLDADGSAERSFGRPGVPRSWLVYGPAEVSLRSFLYQVDFYLHLPRPDMPADPDPDVLAALAAGCVVLLPSRYAAALGDAAVYCEATDVPETVRRLHADKAALRAQAARGPEFVRRHHGHEVYAERAARLATQGHPSRG